jgi:Cryptococcal mannosyltransferase 1
VHLPSGENRVQRITYLAEVRNRLLRPLDPSFAFDKSSGFKSATDIYFDKILFLNDVLFSPLDAIQLLFSTNGGKYRTACSIDFVRGVMFYDSFVVRDIEGYGMGLMFYPWFSVAGNSLSRQDVRSETDAVRVRSCWGGMAAFNADNFRQHQPVGQLSLKFRSTHEPFWEAAECCLLFADIEAQKGPSNLNETGVFVNPYVRVAYTQRTYDLLSFYRRFEKSFEYLQYIVSLVGYPEHNPRRLHEPGQLVNEVVWSLDPRPAQDVNLSQPLGHTIPSSDATSIEHFSIVQRRATAGGFCGQRRMFVMKKDLQEANTEDGGRNWEKVKVPAGYNIF